MPKQVITSIIFLLLIIAFPFAGTRAQNDLSNREQKIRVMFYNVENFFDSYDDSLTLDEEFTPGGERHWNNRKFYDKVNKVYKVIMAAGEWQPPAMVGLCEVENQFVLEKLISETPLKNFGYRIIHHESPDRRGIDVALLYREEFFQPFYDEPVPVVFSDDPGYKTRDILYVKGLVFGKEMIHIFINHWPSRYGGYIATVDRRKQAASILKSKTDSLLHINSNAAILIMGDFNDGPTDESFVKVLEAKPPDTLTGSRKLYNLMLGDFDDWKYGTLKYQGNWDIFDQILVSGSLLDENPGLKIENIQARIFHPDFLLEPDRTYPGVKPFRTFSGFKYNGGFSDHLPVYTDLIRRE